MAQWINQTVPEPVSDPDSQSGFAAMGQPVPLYRREAANRHLKSMGWDRPEDSETRWHAIERMSDALARDEPHQAMQEGMRYLNSLTSTYVIMSVLLAHEDPPPKPADPKPGVRMSWLRASAASRLSAGMVGWLADASRRRRATRDEAELKRMG